MKVDTVEHSRPGPLTLPGRLAATARSVPGGSRWLESLTETCHHLAHRWGLVLEGPYADCHVSLVVPARTRDGRGVVMKVLMPSRFRLGTLLGDVREGEPIALAQWAGRGAVELVAEDRERGAFLMERCDPGESLDAAPSSEADVIAANLLRDLHASESDDRLPHLIDRARRISESLPGRWQALGRPFSRDLVDSAVAAVATLTRGRAADVALHGDFHHHNILASHREPWLAIDPLPARGDGAYDLVQYLLFRQGELADPAGEWAGVVERMCRLAGYDSDRVARWTLVRLVSDAVAALERGADTAELEDERGDLWVARLTRDHIAG